MCICAFSLNIYEIWIIFSMNKDINVCSYFPTDQSKDFSARVIWTTFWHWWCAFLILRVPDKHFYLNEYLNMIIFLPGEYLMTEFYFWVSCYSKFENLSGCYWKCRENWVIRKIYKTSPINIALSFINMTLKAVIQCSEWMINLFPLVNADYRQFQRRPMRLTGIGNLWKWNFKSTQ